MKFFSNLYWWFIRLAFKPVYVYHKCTPDIFWIPFDFSDLEKRPKVYGRYFVCRKDGKIHMETWNGTGWAYNHNEIRFFAVIKNPVKNIIL